jgi:hypothetical protein
MKMLRILLPFLVIAGFISSCTESFDNELDAANNRAMPAKPTDLRANVSADSVIQLTWNAGINWGFVVYRNNAVIGIIRGERMENPEQSYQFTDRDFPVNLALNYRVVALLPNGNESEESISRTVVFGAPSDISVTVLGENNTRILWQDNSTFETGFNIYRRKAAGAFEKIATTTANTTAYIDNTLLDLDTEYTWRVTAESNLNETAGPEQAVTVSLRSPNAVLLAYSAFDTLRVSWQNRANLAQFTEIAFAENDGTFQSLGTVPGTATSYRHAFAFRAGRTYKIRLRAGNNLRTGNWIDAERVFELNAPAQFTLGEGLAQQIQLDFQNTNPFPVDIKLTRAEGPSFTEFTAVETKQVSSNSPGSFTVSGLTDRTKTYRYRISAVTPSDEIAAITAVTVRTQILEYNITRTLNTGVAKLSALNQSQNLRYITFGGQNGTVFSTENNPVKIYDTLTYQEIGSTNAPPLGTYSYVYRTAVTNDGQNVFFSAARSSQTYGIYRWNRTANTTSELTGGYNGVDHLTLDEARQQLIVNQGQTQFSFRNFNYSEVASHSFLSAPMFFISVSQNRTTMASVDFNSGSGFAPFIRCMYVGGGVFKNVSVANHSIHGVQVSNDGAFLYASFMSNAAYSQIQVQKQDLVVSPNTTTPVAAINITGDSKLYGLEKSPDDSRLVQFGQYRLAIIRIPELEIIGQFLSPSEISSVAFGPDDTFWVGLTNGTINVYGPVYGWRMF